jgi:fibrillarin-like pre-rRNA processing protein
LKAIHSGVFKILIQNKIFLVTKNLTPGRIFYNEPIFEYKGEEYRSWNPTKSKLAAAIMNGLENMPLENGLKVLYLGVASGTTCSHISDIVGKKGHIWAIDFSPRALRDLLDNLSPFRSNISPILGDAHKPSSYTMLVPKVDVIYSDVAQPDQAEILIQNARAFLTKGGWAILSIKSRSINVRESPRKIYQKQVLILENNGLLVHELVKLDPFEKDHALAIAEFV